MYHTPKRENISRASIHVPILQPVRRLPPACCRNREGYAGAITIGARASSGATLRDVDIVVHGDLLLNHERDDGTQLIADRSPGQLLCLLA